MTPLERATALFDPTRAEGPFDTSRGYLDLLGEDPPPSPGAGQNLMQSRFYPRVYRWVRPFAFKAFSFATLSTVDERAKARELLRLRTGQSVVDVACGPGNFTGWFGQLVGSTGLAVGVDMSQTMLDQAMLDNSRGPVAYLRGDAGNLPFADASFDAVCCFAALFLMAQPFQAIDEMARILRPGGRIAIMTSYRMDVPVLRTALDVTGKLSGTTMFTGADITNALRANGFTDITPTLSGITQFVGARKPGD